MHYPQVRYYLINPVLGKIKLNFEPINWNEDDKKLVRNEESWGVFTELSNNLQFVKDGKDIIREVYETQGTEAELILERYEAFETNKGYELDYRGHLDLKTYQLEDEKVSVQFLTGGLQSLIESQFDEAYELDRGTDINGNQITPLNYDNVYWEGRRIFLDSLSETPKDPNQFSGYKNDNLTTRYNKVAGFETENIISRNFELRTVYKSQELNVFENFNKQLFEVKNGSDAVPSFLLVSEQTQNYTGVILNINFRTFFKINNVSGIFPNNDLDKFKLNLGLFFYKKINDVWQFQSVDVISEKPDLVNTFWQYKGNHIINLEENEALSYMPFITSKEEINNGNISVTLFNTINKLLFEQNSEFAPTEFNGIRLYDAFNRMLEIYTGERDRIKSNYFDLGQFRNTLLSSGRYIRNLPDARLSVELKDLYETNNYFNLGWSVENINNKEYFVVEDKKYFFQNTVVLDLGEVANLSIRCKSDLLYKSMTFGNPKAGDYEEVQGLQEYNAETTYVSHLKTSDTKYEVNANIRADLVGAELARRKNYSVAPNEDTRYDNENFIFDCKPFEADKFTPKVWQDVLDAEPNVYDPETAGNLLFTPFRSMQRHSKVFNAGMKVYLNKFTRFSNGSGKVDVSTKLAGEPVRAENSDIVNYELETPIFEAVEYQFNLPITNRIRKALKGKTNVQGRLIPNVNFLVKFAYKGQDYTGYILEISYNGQGQWKLIKNYD